MAYKWCVVTQCTNTSVNNPNKLFVSVPKKPKRRNLWLQLARRDPKSIATNSVVFMCEDHFDMEKDINNYMEYKMGFSQKMHLSDEAVPTKFYCQKDRKRCLSAGEYSRSAYLKRRRTELVAECLQIQNDYETPQHTQQSLQKETVIEPEDDSSSDHDDEVSLAPDDEGDEDSLAPDDDGDDDQTIAEHSTDKDKLVHGIIRCNECNKDIIGFRYTCVQCLDVDLCGACEARQLHDTHYVLRIPPARPQEEVSEVILQVRGCLARLVAGSARAPDEPEVTLKMEFKEELPDDPLAEDRDCRPHAENILEQAMLSLELPAAAAAPHADTAPGTSSSRPRRGSKRPLAPEQQTHTSAPLKQNISPHIKPPTVHIQQTASTATLIQRPSSHIVTTVPKMHINAPKIQNPSSHIETPAPQMHHPAPNTKNPLLVIQISPLQTGSNAQRQARSEHSSALQAGKPAPLTKYQPVIQTYAQGPSNKTMKVITLERKSDTTHTRDTSLQAGASKPRQAEGTGFEVFTHSSRLEQTVVTEDPEAVDIKEEIEEIE